MKISEELRRSGNNLDDYHADLCHRAAAEIDELTRKNKRLREACDIFEKNSEACVAEHEARLKAEERNRKLLKCINEGHLYGEEPNCSRCGHYGPGGENG